MHLRLSSQQLMRCFLIDDDRDDREFFSLALESVDRDITCKMCGDPYEALEKLENEDYCPDLIFLDMRMPRMNGMECLGQLRKSKKLKDISTVLYSSTDSEYGSEIAKKSGANYFFTKPASILELSKTLEEVFHHFD
jgi:CheY-like chemotaxis protein